MTTSIMNSKTKYISDNISIIYSKKLNLKFIKIQLSSFIYLSIRMYYM